MSCRALSRTTPRAATSWGHRKGLWRPASRSTANCDFSTATEARRERDQRRQGMGVPQLYRRTDVWRRPSGISRDHRDAIFEDDYLPIAMTLSVFRTFKADIVTGVRGVIIVNSTDPRNPMQCEPIGFESKEFTTQQMQDPAQTAAAGCGRQQWPGNRSVRRSDHRRQSGDLDSVR